VRVLRRVRRVGSVVCLYLWTSFVMPLESSQKLVTNEPLMETNTSIPFNLISIYSILSKYYAYFKHFNFLSLTKCATLKRMRARHDFDFNAENFRARSIICPNCSSFALSLVLSLPPHLLNSSSSSPPPPPSSKRKCRPKKLPQKRKSSSADQETISRQPPFPPPPSNQH